jgi:hypothetical protein
VAAVVVETLAVVAEEAERGPAAVAAVVLPTQAATKNLYAQKAIERGGDPTASLNFFLSEFSSPAK